MDAIHPVSFVCGAIISLNSKLFAGNVPSASLVDWPVSDQCAAAFQLLLQAGTFKLNPVPAFDVDRNPIMLHEYRQKLCGSVVEAHFALVYFPIEGNNPSTFSTVLRKLVVLRPPARTKRSRKCNRRHDVGPFTLNVVEVGRKRRKVVRCLKVPSSLDNKSTM